MTPLLLAALLVLPPAEYDHAYPGELIVVQSEAAVKRCPEGPFAFKPVLGCSFRREDRCLVILAPDDMIRRYGWTTAIVKRHEIGHCNGWPANHPGAR